MRSDHVLLERSSDGRGRRAWWPASRSLLAAAMLVAVMASCGSDSTSTSEPAASDASGGGKLQGTSWTLESATVDGNDVASAATATLAFGDDGTSLSGTTGCNQFGGTYQQDGSDLTITLGAMTAVACADPAVSAQEQAITSGLPKVAAFATGEQLVLKDSSGATLFTYAPGLTSLEGTAWHSTGVNNGRGGVVTTALTETITAQFGDGGALSGFAGCNDYHATYEVSGDNSISITGVATTKKACDEEKTTLEQEYVTALGNVAKYELSGDRLTLRDAEGSTQATYVLTS